MDGAASEAWDDGGREVRVSPWEDKRILLSPGARIGRLHKTGEVSAQKKLKEETHWTP